MNNLVTYAGIILGIITMIAMILAGKIKIIDFFSNGFSRNELLTLVIELFIIGIILLLILVLIIFLHSRLK